MIDQVELEFEEIYTDFRPKVQRYLTRMVGEHEAEDLTQEVFIKISRALDAFRGESQLSTWVYRIATNAALDRLRASSVLPALQRRLQAAPGAHRCRRGSTGTWQPWFPESVAERRETLLKRVRCRPLPSLRQTRPHSPAPAVK